MDYHAKAIGKLPVVKQHQTTSTKECKFKQTPVTMGHLSALVAAYIRASKHYEPSRSAWWFGKVALLSTNLMLLCNVFITPHENYMYLSPSISFLALTP